MKSVHLILTIILAGSSFVGSAQELMLTSEGQLVRNGATNKIHCQRPDSLTSVRMITPVGKVSIGFISSFTSINGVSESHADSIYSWTICEIPSSHVWAVAEGYIGERLVLRDTTWFTVVTDSISPQLLGPEEGKGSDGPWMADELIGVKSPPKSFFENRPGYTVLGYEVRIQQKGKTVDHFSVNGPLLSTEQRAMIGKYAFGEVIIHSIRFRHDCGLELPARNALLLRYAAPR